MGRSSKAKKSSHRTSERTSQLLELGGIRPGPPSAELKALCSVLPDNEYQLLRESGAFNDVELNTGSLDELIAVHEIYDTEPNVSESPVPVYSAVSETPPDELAFDLRYISTELRPAEIRAVLSEVIWRELNGDSMSHLDLSDTVANSIGPSLARNAAVHSDADFGLSTVQYLRVYRLLRYAQASYHVSLCLARLDALLAACETFEEF